VILNSPEMEFQLLSSFSWPRVDFYLPMLREEVSDPVMDAQLSRSTNRLVENDCRTKYSGGSWLGRCSSVRVSECLKNVKMRIDGRPSKEDLK
jgi:hypothetical protein